MFADCGSTSGNPIPRQPRLRFDRAFALFPDSERTPAIFLPLIMRLSQITTAAPIRGQPQFTESTLESVFTELIAAEMRRKFSTVRQTLRSLREGGIIPGRRRGDITTAHLPAIIVGLCSPTYADAPDYVHQVMALRLNSAVDLPQNVGDLLQAIVATISTTPVLGDLDLDDGVIHIAQDRLELETLHITGQRSVVRYGADIWVPASTPMRRISLNSIRKLAHEIGRKP